MKFSSKLVVSVLVCLSLAACNKSVEEKVAAKEGNGNDAGEANGMRRKLPECAQRNEDGTYKYGSGCTAEQWVKWQETQDVMTAPSE